MRMLRIFLAGLIGLAMLTSVGSARAEVSGDNGDLQVTLYNFSGDLADYPFDRKPWETRGLADFTQCDVLATDNINDFWEDMIVPYSSEHCNGDNWLARFNGTISVPASGSYRFKKSSDDGFALFISGTNLIQEWGEEHGMDSVESDPIDLIEGQTYSFEAWLYDGCCNAGAILQSNFAGAGWQIIPSTWFGEGGGANCGDLDAAVCPTITDAGTNRVTGAPGTDYTTARATYTWLRCRSEGDAIESRRVPNGCRVIRRVSSTAARMENAPYRISAGDRSWGYLRLAVTVGRTTYYSGAYDLNQ